MSHEVFPARSVDLTRVHFKRDHRGSNSSAAGYRARRFQTLDLICTSHIDLPMKLTAYPPDLVAEVSGCSEREIRKLIGGSSQCCEARRYPMTMIDVTKKARDVLAIIHDKGSRSPHTEAGIPLLPAKYAFEQFEEFRSLFLNLCITKEEIQEHLTAVDPASLKDTILTFYTDWYDQFDPEEVEFYGIYELWHPFLFHPYLDERAAAYVVDELKIAGLATDAPTLEPPIYYVSSKKSVVPNVAELRTAVSTGIRTKHVVLPPNPFLHIRTLCNRRLIVESLDLHRIRDARGKVVRGDLVLIPMLTSEKRSESIIVRAQFVPVAADSSTQPGEVVESAKEASNGNR